MSGLKSSRFAPWAGLYAGALGWALHHQLGSNLAYADCTKSGPLLTIGLGLACALLVLLGAWLSWSARDATGAADRHDTRRFAAVLSVAGAGLFLLAIGFQSFAGALIPACHQ